MKKFPVDISESGIRALLNSPDSYARRFTETSLRALLNYSEIQGTLSNQKNEFPPVPWEMEKLRAKVKSEVSKHVFGWYAKPNLPLATAPGEMSKLFQNTASPPAISDRINPSPIPKPWFSRPRNSASPA